MGVIFWEQVLDSTYFAHKCKEIGVIEEDDMEAHLDVIAFWIFPAGNSIALRK